jgi:hypothetical protein
LKVEPSNAQARLERTKTAQMIREYEKIKTATPKGVSTVEDVKVRSNTVPSVDPSKSSKDEMMAERSSRRIQNTVVSDNSDTSMPPPPSTSSGATPPTPPTLPTPISASTSTTTAPKTSATNDTISKDITKSKSIKKEPTIPSEAPKNLYELERSWRGLKDRPDLFGQYLTLNIKKKSVVKKVFIEAISPELLSSVFISLRDYCAADVTLIILGGLSTCKHFTMTLALLLEEDLKCIQSIFGKLLTLDVSNDNDLKESILNLKSIYKL